MLWRNKRAEQAENQSTKFYKTLWENCFKAQSKLRSQVYCVEAAFGVIHLYPKGEGKDAATERFEEQQEKLVILLDDYHKALLTLFDYFSLHQAEITVDWRPNQWRSGEDIIEDTYRNIHHLPQHA